MAWIAEPQAEERRECEPRSGSKPSVTAASGSCRLNSAAAWGRKRTAEERLRLTSDVLKDRGSEHRRAARRVVNRPRAALAVGELNNVTDAHFGSQLHAVAG